MAPPPEPPDAPVAPPAACTVTVAARLSCAPALSVTVKRTVKLPGPLVTTVAVGPLLPPLKAAMALPLVISQRQALRLRPRRSSPRRRR
jgi:hypothetical protein